MSELIPISVSRLGSFKSCQRRYFYRYVEGLKPQTKSDALVAGTDVHTLIEQHYKGETPVLDGVGDKALAGFHAYATYSGIFDDFKVTHTELEFSEPIEGTPFLLRGYIDAVAVRGEQTWVMEHKTAARFWNSKRIALDEQPVIYETLAQELLGVEVAGTIRNFIRLTERKGAWHGEVKREYIPTTPVKQATVFQNMLETAQQAAERTEKGTEEAFLRNPGEQCQWCPFFMVCEAAYTGADVQYVKDTYFDKEDHDTSEGETEGSPDGE